MGAAQGTVHLQFQAAFAVIYCNNLQVTNSRNDLGRNNLSRHRCVLTMVIGRTKEGVHELTTREPFAAFGIPQQLGNAPGNILGLNELCRVLFTDKIISEEGAIRRANYDFRVLRFADGTSLCMNRANKELIEGSPAAERLRIVLHVISLRCRQLALIERLYRGFANGPRIVHPLSQQLRIFNEPLRKPSPASIWMDGRLILGRKHIQDEIERAKHPQEGRCCFIFLRYPVQAIIVEFDIVVEILVVVKLFKFHRFSLIESRFKVSVEVWVYLEVVEKNLNDGFGYVGWPGIYRHD